MRRGAEGGADFAIFKLKGQLQGHLKIKGQMNCKHRGAQGDVGAGQMWIFFSSSGVTHSGEDI